MYWRAHQITKEIRKYDRMLYAEMKHGRIDIFRKTFGHESFEVDGRKIMFLKEVPYRVFCLTDTWSAWGKPVEWGIEPIMAKLRSADLWNRNVGEEVNNHNEKIDASKLRDHKNNIEAFVKDYRKEFSRTFDDVNTANMSKRTDRRFKDERKIKLKG